MLWTSKLSDMKNKKIIDDSTQAENEKNTAANNTANIKNINMADNTLSQKTGARKLLFSFFHSVFIIIFFFLVFFILIFFFLYVVPFFMEFSPQKKTKITKKKELMK